MGTEPPRPPESLGETPPRELAVVAVLPLHSQHSFAEPGSGRHLSHATWEPRAAGVCLGQLIRRKESLLGPPIFP